LEDCKNKNTDIQLDTYAKSFHKFIDRLQGINIDDESDEMYLQICFYAYRHGCEKLICIDKDRINKIPNNLNEHTYKVIREALSNIVQTKIEEDDIELKMNVMFDLKRTLNKDRKTMMYPDKIFFDYTKNENIIWKSKEIGLLYYRCIVREFHAKDQFTGVRLFDILEMYAEKPSTIQRHENIVHFVAFVHMLQGFKIDIENNMDYLRVLFNAHRYSCLEFIDIDKNRINENFREITLGTFECLKKYYMDITLERSVNFGNKMKELFGVNLMINNVH
jgi:hypothetical protein